MATTLADGHDLTDTDLLTSLTCAHDDLTRHKARFLISLAEFDARDLARAAGAPSTVCWLGRALDVADKTAYEYLGVSRTLGKFPLIAAAFLAAELSYSKIRLLASHLTPENEAELLALAVALSLNELALALAGRRSVDDDDGPREDSFKMWIDKNTGRYRFSGDLSPELGAKFAAALKCGELANLRDLADVDPQERADDEAVGELIDAAEAEAPALPATDGKGHPVTRFGPPLRSALLSGLLGMMNLARTAETSARQAPGAQVHVMVTEDGHAFLPANPGAPSDLLKDLVLNGRFRGHLLDAKGVTMKMGRARRLVTPGQETALLARWMFQCAMPACNHARFLEFHHIVEYSAGGCTDTDNLIPLCSACHALVTSGMAKIEVEGAALRFSFRDGSVYLSQNRSLPMKVGQEPGLFDAPAAEWRGDWDESGALSFDDDDSARAEKPAPARGLDNLVQQ
ncbi:hypothetical protein B841_05185 [Corynebacterium maris DSM 45190]|uniref:HNH nuclease domain-containing protein n=1 Tax=Corynebacterium maris DSM 45190 TaxID=1224163 RepID=S5T1T1_9CORY|nr:HNH endonuclease signature motif containing protein [Corynebacterium maris]AGS34510.1 hypothetical protein B841_05185 [Corynebacterium maris DSM 45190]